jgi:hypothetical protein
MMEACASLSNTVLIAFLEYASWGLNNSSINLLLNILPIISCRTKINNLVQKLAMGHSRKHPYHPHGGNRKLTPLPPSDVLIHLLLSETIFSPLPLQTAEISSVGGVWIFSGTTQ